MQSLVYLVIKMKALRFDMEIPYWCSFGDFSSLNIKLTYPFPPLTTLFGMIQNAMGKVALHNINNKKEHKRIEKKYIENFNNLKFAIIIKDNGEVIEDYTNIHKGNRQQEKYENELKDKLKHIFKENDLDEKDFKNIHKYNFYNYLINGSINKKDLEEYKKIKIFCDKEEYKDILNTIIDYWIEHSNGVLGYNLNKKWISTQIHRQMIINPSYSIYIISNDNDEFSLDNIYRYLKNPLRPLYIGESNDAVTLLNMKIVEIVENKSSEIASVLPDLHSNSELIKVPINLKYNKDSTKDIYEICSIPKGTLYENINCYTFKGENFVFL